MKHKISMLFSKSQIVLVTLILFAFGLLTGIYFSFPETKVKQQIISSIEKQGHVIINQGDINIGLLRLKGSDLQIRPENPLWPTIPINSLIVTPQWLTLLSKNPGIQLDMQLLEGTLWAEMFRDGTLNLTASQLNLAFLSPKDQEMTVSGQLAEMTLSSVVPLKKTSESIVTLRLKSVHVTRNSDLKIALNLGDILITSKGRGRSFNIISLNADNGDLSISGKGSILIGRDIPSTQVNMKIEIRPEETVDPMVVELLKLGTRQTPSGSYELRLSGSLSEL